MKENFCCDKEWKSEVSSNFTQIDISGCKRIFLKKEVGKGDVYRFRIRNEGVTKAEYDKLFSKLFSMIKDNGFDCILEVEGDFFSTGEKSKKMLKLFSEMQTTSGTKISNHLCAFSFKRLPFVHYKYNVKLFPKTCEIQIFSSFKGTHKNHSKYEKSLFSLDEALIFIKEYRDEIEYINKKRDELREFVQNIDPNGRVSNKKGGEISYFKKDFSYKLSKHEERGYHIHYKHQFQEKEVLLAKTLNDAFNEMKRHIKYKSNCYRLEALMN
jgi:hypothetical protein